MGQRALADRNLQGLNTWLFLAPALLFFVGYQVYPIIRVFWISFTDFQFLTDEPANWVGLGNYVEALNDPLMWVSLWRAALFTMMFLPGTIIFPLLLAILVDDAHSRARMGIAPEYVDDLAFELDEVVGQVERRLGYGTVVREHER